MTKPERITIDRICVSADKGAPLYEVQLAAARLCLEMGVPVVLTHNDETYTADPKRMMHTITED